VAVAVAQVHQAIKMAVLAIHGLIALLTVAVAVAVPQIILVVLAVLELAVKAVEQAQPLADFQANLGNFMAVAVEVQVTLASLLVMELAVLATKALLLLDSRGKKTWHFLQN
jgi:hypothetical protein